MTFTKMLKSALFQLDDLKEVKTAAFSKIIAFVIGLTVILSLPITLQTWNIFHEIQGDSQKIAEKIPDFSIQNNRLHTEATEKGFIYQTNSIIFTFDPEGKRSTTDIASDMIGNLLSIGLLKEELVISLPSSGVTDSLFDGNQIVIPYSEAELANLNGQTIRTTLQNHQIPWWLTLLIFFISLYPIFLNLIFTLLMTTFIGTIYSRMRLYQLKFFDNLKIMIVSSTLPILMGVIIQLWLPAFDITTFILFGSLFIFTRGIKNSAKISPS